jgi:hypothetical protein
MVAAPFRFRAAAACAPLCRVARKGACSAIASPICLRCSPCRPSIRPMAARIRLCTCRLSVGVKRGKPRSSTNASRSAGVISSVITALPTSNASWCGPPGRSGSGGCHRPVPTAGAVRRRGGWRKTRGWWHRLRAAPAAAEKATVDGARHRSDSRTERRGHLPGAARQDQRHQLLTVRRIPRSRQICRTRPIRAVALPFSMALTVGMEIQLCAETSSCRRFKASRRARSTTECRGTVDGIDRRLGHGFNDHWFC